MLYFDQTGTGKSILFQLTTVLESDLLTVVVVPLRSLLEDLLEQCQSLGIECNIWNGTLRAGSSRLVFVSVEDAQPYGTFNSFLDSEVHLNRLARIVIDEAHVLDTWMGFREKLRSLLYIRMYPRVQLVLLSATIPRSKINWFEINFAAHFVEIRQPTIPHNIRYEVHHHPTKEHAYNDLLEQLQIVQQPSDRAIIYCMTKAECDRLAKVLGCCKYYSIDPKDPRHDEMVRRNQESIQQWKCAHRKVMVATVAFGMGINYPSVRLVVHWQATSSLLDFIQESGRCGRDGQPAKSIVLDFENNHDDRIDQSFQEYLRTTRCRTQLIERHLHGSGLPCMADPGRTICDNSLPLTVEDERRPNVIHNTNYLPPEDSLLVEPRLGEQKRYWWQNVRDETDGEESSDSDQKNLIKITRFQ